MNLVKCSNGHYYDGEKFESCPHCEGVNSSIMNSSEATLDMQSFQTASMQTDSITDTVPNTPAIGGTDVTDDIEMTIGIGSYYNEENHLKVEPVVGWLVCVEGSEFGRSFSLKAGKNFIGRNSAANDIIIKGDQSISREKHAIIVYDPKSGNFHAQPGTSSELFYINNEVVLQVKPIKDRDVLTIGSTRLVFVPFCNDDFTW